MIVQNIVANSTLLFYFREALFRLLCLYKLDILWIYKMYLQNVLKIHKLFTNLQNVLKCINSVN